jgi:Disulphide bond corrector protein DsbC
MLIRKISLIVILTLLLLTACSCSSNQPGTAGPTPPNTPAIRSENVVRFGAEPVEIKAGSSSEATVHVTVQKGYHVNANPPTFSYLKATELELSPTAGMTVAFIKYPDAISKQFPFAEKPIAIYEGDTQVKVQLKVASSAPKGLSNVNGKLKIQACDDQVCYPPGEIAVAIPVTIK